MKRFWVTLVIPLLFVFGARAPAATFIDEAGRTLEVNGPPQRIVSVAPNVTEILFALGLEDRLVGVSVYCQYPPEALKKEKIGGYINPSLEKIVALRPDLVIGIAEGDLKTFVDKLAGLKVPVYIANPRDALQVLTSIQKIGEVTFAQEPARKIVRSMEERVWTIQDKVQGQPRPRVLHILDFNPLISAGKGTFVDDLIRFAGGRNVAETATGKYPRFSMEEVLVQDPEVILLASMKSRDPMVKQRRWWERWKTISAVKQGRIYVLDSDLIHRPSPRMAEGLERVARAIHPEVFKSQ
ncbi:MAG: ABC-type transporter cobalamide binding protein [Deltaproteobacteria bacterium]|nr:ABC-type transporter cobalamide binding protein [Deltaproteobacteria bacterium]